MFTSLNCSCANVPGNPGWPGAGTGGSPPRGCVWCVDNSDLLAWWQVRSTSLLYHLGRTCLMQSYSCCFGPVVSAKTQAVKAINQGCMFVNNGLSFERFESLTLTRFCFSKFQKSSAGVSESSPRILVVPRGGYMCASAHETP